VNLYTREYFRLAHDVLADGGLVSYWLPLHDLSDRSALAILRAFCDVFHDCSLWRGQASSLVMLGSKRFHVQADRARFERLWNERPDADDLRAVGFEEPGQLGALFLGDRAYLEDLTAGTTALHDDDPAVLHAGFDGPPLADNPTIGHAASRSALFESWTHAGNAALERWRRNSLTRGLFPPEIAAQADSLFWVQDAIDDLESGRKLAPATVIRLLTTTSLRYPILIWAGTSPDDIAAARRLRTLGLDAPDVHYALAIDALADRDGVRARESLARAGGRAFDQHAAEVDQVIEAITRP